MGSVQDDPIAIVGMAAKLPQDASTVDKFWDMLCENRSALSEIPKDRFNIDGFYHPEYERVDSINVRKAHFLSEDVSAFDAPFFGISSAEAATMDPQQRILLETAYHTIEDAGWTLDKITGSKTSVYVASSGIPDYSLMLFKDTEVQTPYAATSAGTAFLANRISHFFDLRGPSVFLDTACSGSMHALYLACQSIQSGDADASLVGGCNLILSPDGMIPLSNAGFLNPDGACRSFDHKANGYARGEGFVVVALKRLSQAVTDGDHIRAIVRSIRVGGDGRTPSISQPNTQAQTDLILATYEKANLDMSVTQYCEAHGTGTIVGDPMEAKAIGEAFRKHRPPDSPLLVGSVKANIGHLEGASGLASLVKTVRILETGLIPGNPWLEKVNPGIDADGLKLKFPKQLTSWPTEGLRRASISNFGNGGAICHVVLDDAYNYLLEHRIAYSRSTSHTSSRNQYTIPCAETSQGQLLSTKVERLLGSRYRLLLLSGADENAPNRLATALAEAYALKSFQQCSIDSLCLNMNENRSILPWRSFAILDKQSSFPNDLETSMTKSVRSAGSPNVVFAFTGQGAQWTGMGAELLAYPHFRQSVEAAQSYLHTIGCKWSLLDELLEASQTRINEPEISQTLCTVLQVALVDLLAAMDIYPDYVVGHSSGEIAAAYGAQAISRTSAWALAYFRGQAASQFSPLLTGAPREAMLAVSLSEEDCLTYIQTRNLQQEVSVACVNSPKNCTLSGRSEAIDTLKHDFDEFEVFSRKLAVNRAYHSPYMVPAGEAYAQLLGEFSVPDTLLESNSSIVYSSSVEGDIVSPTSLRNSEYWVRNLLQPVNFCGSVEKLMTHLSSSHERASTWIEIGPNPALQRPLKDIIKHVGRTVNTTYIPTVQKGKNAVQSMLRVVGTLFTQSYKLNVSALNPFYDKSLAVRPLSSLPHYPFDHSRKYWFESRISKTVRERSFPKHELLGVRDLDWSTSLPSWRNIFKVSEQSWLRDHGFANSPILPATACITMAIEAARQFVNNDAIITGYHLKDISYSKSIPLSQRAKGTETRIVLKPQGGALQMNSPWFGFQIMAYIDLDWIEVCDGHVQARLAADGSNTTDTTNRNTSTPVALEFWDNHHLRMNHCERIIHRDQFYENLAQMGYQFGPTFSLLKSLRYSKDKQGSAQITFRSSKSAGQVHKTQTHVIHPTTLDAITQTGLLTITNGTWTPIPALAATKTKELWVSSQLLTNTDIAKLDLSAENTFSGYREFEFTISATEALTGTPLLMALGHRGVSTGSTPQLLTTQHDDAQRLAYSVRYAPDLQLNSNAEIRAYIENLTKDVEERSMDVNKRDRALVLHYIAKWLPFASSFDGSMLKPPADRFVAWMQEVARKELGATSNSPFPEVSNKHILNGENLDPITKMLTVVGNNLGNLIEGRQDLVELMFSGTLAQDAYSTFFNKLTRKIAKYLDLHAHANPQQRILEIGAGTGSATRTILEELTGQVVAGDYVPRFANYTFSDVSHQFFERARPMFPNVKGQMDFKVFDIGADPRQQGFDAETFDIIVGASVVHATPELEKTLRNLKTLLKPGGKLVLIEPCNPENIENTFAVGLFPGWWLGTESFRSDSPLVSESKWDELMREVGFSGLDIVFRDYDDPMHHNYSVLITSKPVAAPQRDPREMNARIVSSLSSQVQSSITGVLISQLSDLTISSTVTNLNSDVSKEQNLSSDLLICLIDLEQDVLQDMTEVVLENLKLLIPTTRHVVWVTHGAGRRPSRPEVAKIEGFARVMCSEYLQTSFTVLALEDVSSVERIVQRLMIVAKAVISQSVGEHELEYVEDKGMLCINRLDFCNEFNDKIQGHIRTDKDLTPESARIEDVDAYATVTAPGLLQSLQFQELEPVGRGLSDGQVDVEVVASSLNFKDLLIALGQIPGNSIGFDAAGVVRSSSPDSVFQKADRVIICCVPGTLRTVVRCSSHSLVRLPDHVSFEAAASLPAVLTTAHYALLEVARLKRGETVLIHAGAGGVGQMAIQLATMVGATVYATAGSEQKREFLSNTYGLARSHLFSSRDASFVSGIRYATRDRGVDVVLNCLTGELLHASLSILAPSGRFLEIGKRDIMANSEIGMAVFSRGLTFAAVDLAWMLAEGQLKDRVAQAFDFYWQHSHKMHEPRPLRCFPASQLEQAFRSIQSNDHYGKTVVTFSKPDTISLVRRVRPTWTFDAAGLYVLAGGFGGLGRAIAEWMIERGARKFLILSRSGVNGSVSRRRLLEDLNKVGAQVQAPACDVTDASKLSRVLKEAIRGMGPIRGCFQLSMVLRDEFLERMTLQHFEDVLPPKVAGSWNLSQLLPSDMDFFVLFSSMGGWFGIHTCSNYASANAYQEALARHLTAQGRKCVSLAIGMVLDVGYTAENHNVAAQIKRNGMPGFTERQLMGMLEGICDPTRPIPVSPEKAQILTGIVSPRGLKNRGFKPMWWQERNMFRILHNVGILNALKKSDSLEKTDDGSNVSKVDMSVLSQQSSKDLPIEQKVNVLAQLLRSKLASIICIPEQDIDPSRPIYMIGVDSLIAIEIRYLFMKGLGLDVAVHEILRDRSLVDLCKYVIGLLPQDEG